METFEEWLENNDYQDEFLKYEREVWDHQQQKIEKLEAEIEKLRGGEMSKRLEAWLGFNDGKCNEDTQLLIDDIKCLVKKLQAAERELSNACEPVGILNKKLEAEKEMWRHTAYKAGEKIGELEAEIKKLRSMSSGTES